MTTNKHPAHSPLTSRRLHQMRDILSKAAAQRDGGDIGYAMSDAVKLIGEALAGSEKSSPAITADEIKLFGREMWFAGWYESRHTPNPSGDCNRAFRGTEMAERLATSARSGKNGA